MSDSEATLKITCCHDKCGKPFHIRVTVVSDDKSETEQVVECLHCGQPVKITIPKKYAGKSVMMIRGAKAE